MIFSTCKTKESEYPVLKQSLTCPRRLVKENAIHPRKLPKTSPKTGPFQKERLVFQPLFFRDRVSCIVLHPFLLFNSTRALFCSWGFVFVAISCNMGRVLLVLMYIQLYDYWSIHFTLPRGKWTLIHAETRRKIQFPQPSLWPDFSVHLGPVRMRISNLYGCFRK